MTGPETGPHGGLAMPAAPKPIDEQQRLAELRALDILDTPPEARFERVTRLARRLFDVPIALVSLVDDDRQWFKSAQGIAFTETPRGDSFCAHAILRDDVMVVNDARQDPRFVDNRFVLDNPGIRFYAGCPITAPGGAKVGTLCVVGHEVREFTAEEIESLQDLAAIVEREVATAQLAIADPLTGLNNRRGFFMHAEQLARVCERHQVPLTLAYFDLDHFKSINDQFGHDVGDEILREFAQVLGRQVRESDIVARVGGDEFVALLTHATEGSDAGDRISRTFTAGNGHSVSVSFGSATRQPGDDVTLDQLVHQADLAMYERKREAKARRTA
jgi:diguanylate cyclase (GGDEF)-like protein